MDLYSRDPNTGKASVSLTILWISVVLLVVVGVLQCLKQVESTTLALEFFGISASLYFGRRVNFNGKNTQIDDGENNDTK